MSATISLNWLESFKNNLACGSFPSKTSNPYIEMLTGLVGIEIENLLCECPTALDAPDVASPNIQDNDKDSLSMWYGKIKCGELFESDSQALAVLAMVKNKLLTCCTVKATEETAEETELVINKTNSYVATAEDFDATAKRSDSTAVITKASAATYTVPLNATIPVPIGSRIKIIQGGAGGVTLTPEGGVTLVGTLVTNAQWKALLVEKIAVNTWHSVLVA